MQLPGYFIGDSGVLGVFSCWGSRRAPELEISWGVSCFPGLVLQNAPFRNEIFFNPGIGLCFHFSPLPRIQIHPEVVAAMAAGPGEEDAAFLFWALKPPGP